MIENLKGEVWMVHPKYPWLAASNLGRVKSLERDIIRSNGRPYHWKECLMKLQPKEEGYLQFQIKKDGKIIAEPLAHRFVYECMNQIILPKGNKELQINHIDENKQNNKISNLELVTPSQNSNWGTRNERIAKAKINNPKRSKQVGQFTLDGELVKIWESTRECGRNKYDQGHVSACCRNCFNREGNNVYKGYKWQYIKNE